MFNVCPQCGEYSVEKIIDASGPVAICPFCGYAHPFLQLPLFLLTGPSGAGKTTICLELSPLLPECVILESDILWGAVTTPPEDRYLDYRNVWLRVAKNVGQSGRPVVLCGTAIPEEFEACPERRYFSTLHFLAVVCDDQLLEDRLKQRPAWRHSGSTENIEHMIRFNQWLKEHASTTRPPMTLLDTSHRSIPEKVREVAQWIRLRL
ncbi:MAG TPA: AAA family ATPase [Ktedonobacteraceae bacterium]|nr:AAA family ATPase [Ktedonobacteraceae bacterium]